MNIRILMRDIIVGGPYHPPLWRCHSTDAKQAKCNRGAPYIYWGYSRWVLASTIVALSQYGSKAGSNDASLFPFDLPIEDQPPQATWPCCGFGRSWCANVRRCRIHPSQRQSSAAVLVLSGPACAKPLPFTGMSLLPALLPCCDKATMVDATAHLLYPQYM